MTSVATTPIKLTPARIAALKSTLDLDGRFVAGAVRKGSASLPHPECQALVAAGLAESVRYWWAFRLTAEGITWAAAVAQ